jgi:hypothetical protein
VARRILDRRVVRHAQRLWTCWRRLAAFNLWATFLSSIGVGSIAAARLASNLPAACLMIVAAVQFSRRLPGQATFYAAMLLLTLSLPQAVETFVNYRSYFWQIAALATLVLVARHVVVTDVDDQRLPAVHRRPLHLPGVCPGLVNHGGIGSKIPGRLAVVRAARHRRSRGGGRT